MMEMKKGQKSGIWEIWNQGNWELGIMEIENCGNQ